jgi:hypothetical protein
MRHSIPQRWTEEKVAYLKEHYVNGDTEKIAEVLGHSIEQVRAKANVLGLRKSPEKVKEMRLKCLALGNIGEKKIEKKKGEVHKRIHSGTIVTIGHTMTHYAF